VKNHEIANNLRATEVGEKTNIRKCCWPV